MSPHDFNRRLPLYRKRLASAAVAAIALALSPMAPAQVGPVILGSLGNFDVFNNTFQEAHGFEIELQGVKAADIYRIFGYWPALGGNVIRYGSGTANDTPLGTIVRWASPYDPATGTFTLATPVPTTRTTVPYDSCWTVGLGQAYYTAGCEHFGISATKNSTTTTYRWLVADPNVPGALVAAGSNVSVPAPVWTVIPPAPPVQPNAPVAPPVVVAEIVAPPAPEPAKFGDAQWVKVYKTENNREVVLDELLGNNPAVVPQDPAQLEVSWNLLQADPQDGSKQKRKGRQVNQGNIGAGNRAVLRRYEYYEYSGVYDPLTHEALCGGDGTCTAPLAGELGNAIGAQNAAANVHAASLTVTKTGTGLVENTDKSISCGSKCSNFYADGAAITLTAKPASGNVFSAWGGACTGSLTTCSVTINEAVAVTANFVAAPAGGGGGGGAGTPSFTLSVGRSNPGTVTGTPVGLDRALDCGNACSAKFAQGTAVTLTATPPAGKTFASWGGACSGTTPTCIVTGNTDLSVQANFNK